MYSGHSVLLNFAMRWPVLVPLAALGSVVTSELPQAQPQTLVMQAIAWVSSPPPATPAPGSPVLLAVGP